MDHEFTQHILTIKQAQEQHSQQSEELLAEQKRAPERLRGAFESAINNLQTQQLESLETYLSSTEIVDFINTQAAQIREDLATIQKLQERGLISEAERVQFVTQLFDSEDYADFLAITSTAFEVFDEETNPFNVSILLASASPENEEDTTADTNMEVEPIQKDATNESKSETSTTSTDEDILEIIEVVYGTQQNKFYINGISLNDKTYRHTVDTRMALIKAIAALPGGEPVRPSHLYDIATDQYGLGGDEANKVNLSSVRNALDWIYNNVRTTDGVSLAEHNGSLARAARITRTLGISAIAHIVDSYPETHDEVTSEAEPPDDLSEFPRVAEDTTLDLDHTDDEFVIDITDGGFVDAEIDVRRDIYTIERLISPEFRDHIRSLIIHLKHTQQFSVLPIPDILSREEHSVITVPDIDLELLADARQLLVDVVDQSNEFLELILELYDIVDPTPQQQQALVLMQQLEDIFQSDEIEGYILAGHIYYAEESLASASEDRQYLEATDQHGASDILAEINPGIIETIEDIIYDLLSNYSLTDTLGSLQAVNIVGLKTRDLAMARQSGVIARGNSEKQGAKLSVDKIIRVFAYSKLRNIAGMSVAKAEKITSEIISRVTGN